MNSTVTHKHNSLFHSSNVPLCRIPSFSSGRTHFYRTVRKRTVPVIRYSSLSGNGNGPSDGMFWRNLSQSFRLVSERFYVKFKESVKKETGVDFSKGEAEFTRFKTDLLPKFLDWNRLERWKDLKNWEPKRVAALILYAFVVMFSFQGMYVAVRAPYLDRQKKEETEAFMESLIPEPSPVNIRKFKKGLWKKTVPKGLKMKKFIKGPDGTLVRDTSYVGEDAWDDDAVSPEENLKQIIEKDNRLNTEEKKELEEDLGISASKEQGSVGPWRRRLYLWQELLNKEKLAEQLDVSNAKYALNFDMKEVENSLRKDVVKKLSDSNGATALWISKRWWQYRPTIPYTYFLQKLDSSEASFLHFHLLLTVAAVVFTEDLKRVYITMKEGFPLEYVVNIPLDPYLFESIASSGVEVDLLQKRQIHYFLKLLIALGPGLLVLLLISTSIILLNETLHRFMKNKHRQLHEMIFSENLIVAVGADSDTKSKYKDVVLGGDVWDLLDEIMIYMRNPMQYYEKRVKFVRGILMSGPPGTGKTLFARALSKEGGLPFVFASGAEFTDSETSGAAKINQMFIIARRNAPSFVFIDEIDAIAGKQALKDAGRRPTYDALIAQLDGEKEQTGVDRFSPKQAVIFICATNRPDELHPEFICRGRIDRRLYIGLPDAKQRVQIFSVHSAGKQLAEDVDFRKLVYRTAGFSGADIRNLVNEAAIMSVRKGHPKVYQQDVVDVLDKQLLEGMGVLLTKEEQQKCEENVSVEKRRLLAVHEAGHIVLSHLFPRFDWHAFSQLLPGGKETALTVFYPREEMIDQGYTTFGYMKMQMVVSHGGRCAERLVFGDITDGGSDDLEKITKLAREMVISPQNAKLGLTAVTKKMGIIERPDSSDEGKMKYRACDASIITLSWDDPFVIPVNLTIEESELFTREMTRYIEETEELAMKGLRDNMDLLDMIVKELMEKTRITGLEVEKIMEGLSPVMLEDIAKPFQISPNDEEETPHKDKLRYQPLDIYPAPLHRC
ncbi:ATP-dependent zinc metalloprotease FTSH 12, chloroplastic [Linum perenne]